MYSCIYLIYAGRLLCHYCRVLYFYTSIGSQSLSLKHLSLRLTSQVAGGPALFFTSIDIWLITLTEVNYCRMASTWGLYLGHRNQRKWSIFFISCLSIVSKHPGMCVRDSRGGGIAAGNGEGVGTAECSFSPVCFSMLFRKSAYW